MAGVRLRPAAALLLLATLAGCSTVPPETQAEAAARRSVSCAEAGFARDTSDFKLCLLLQEANERLDAMDRRLRFIEQDTRLTGPYLGPRWW